MSEWIHCLYGARAAELGVQCELVVVLYVQLLFCIIRHVRVQLCVGPLRGRGARAAARRRQLAGRDCVSVLRALDPGGLGRLVSFSTPPGGAAVLHLPLTALRILLRRMAKYGFISKEQNRITFIIKQKENN